MALEEKNKFVIENCIHYYDIINFKFSDDDILTKNLIRQFSDEIFAISSNNDGTENRLKVLDMVMYEYILKEDFYYFAREYFVNNSDAIDILYDELLGRLISVFRDFTFKDIKIEKEDDEPRWL